MEDHAAIMLKGDKLVINIQEELAAAHTFLNGKYVDKNKQGKYIKELKDLDRIIFGSNTTFLVRLPVEGVIKKEKVEEEGIDWEFC